MALLEVINRGFGGALIGDCVRYADRIVVPYRPRGVVLTGRVVRDFPPVVRSSW
jgi:hypothetical protein